MLLTILCLIVHIISNFNSMKSYLYLLILLSLTIYSCKKGTANFVIKGSITDNTFSTSLTGATVKLFQTPAGTTQSNLIGTAVIGSDGTYKFEFPRDKMEKYTLVITKDLYFEINSTIYFSELTIKDDNTRNYSTTAKSWVKLHFVNQSPSSTSDHLQYIKQLGKEGCPECCTDTEQNLYGILDSSIFCINDGNTEYSYMYTVFGTTNQGIKSVMTVPFDTTELLLYY